MNFLIYTLLTIHVIVCVLMVIVVLMQRPRNEGLGAAFGGGMTDNIFGAQTTHVLAKFTTWLGGSFFLLTLVLAMLFAHTGTPQASKITEELLSMPEPAAAATPAAETTEPAATETQPAAEDAAEPESIEATPAAVDPAAESVNAFEAVGEDAAPAAEAAPESAPAEPAPAAPNPAE